MLADRVSHGGGVTSGDETDADGDGVGGPSVSFREADFFSPGATERKMNKRKQSVNATRGSKHIVKFKAEGVVSETKSERDARRVDDFLRKRKKKTYADLGGLVDVDKPKFLHNFLEDFYDWEPTSEPKSPTTALQVDMS